MLAALANMYRVGSISLRQTRREIPIWWVLPNVLAMGFGLIHGLGFSNYLRTLLGSQRRPVLELLSFNLGVEGGQLLVVGIVLAVGFVVWRVAGVARRDWVLATSGAAFGIAALLLVQLLS